MNGRILILGATGMLGRVAYTLLKSKNKLTVGTSRKKNTNLIYFDFDKNSTEVLIDKVKPDFIINCIAQLQDPKITDYSINYLLPEMLSKMSTESKGVLKLIHISSDAVFEDNIGKTDESSPTKTRNTYGLSKLKGEFKNVLNIRTSIIGLDPTEHKGMLENVLNHVETIGYTNHTWTGTTTLQLSEFLFWLTQNNNHDFVFGKTNIVHFAPIGPITKYHLLSRFSKIVKRGKVLKGKGKSRTRFLASKFVDEIGLGKYTNNLDKILTALANYDKDYLKK